MTRQTAAATRQKSQSFFSLNLSIGVFWCMLDTSHTQSPCVPHGTPYPAWHEAQVGLLSPATFVPRLYFPDAYDSLFCARGTVLTLTFPSPSHKAAQWKWEASNGAGAAVLAPLKPSGGPWSKFIALSCFKGESIRETTFCSRFLHLLHDLSKGISPFTASVSTSAKINGKEIHGVWTQSAVGNLNITSGRH